MAFGAVPAPHRPIREDARAAGAFPPEGAFFDFDNVIGRATKRERFHSGSGENFGHAFSMTKTVGGPGDRHINIETIAEISLAVGELAEERFGSREIGVGLNDRAADDVPAALLHITFDS